MQSFAVMLRVGAWRRAISGLTKAQERAFGAAATAPAQGLDASLPEISENHKGPVGVLQVSRRLRSTGSAQSFMSLWLAIYVPQQRSNVDCNCPLHLASSKRLSCDVVTICRAVTASVVCRQVAMLPWAACEHHTL